MKWRYFFKSMPQETVGVVDANDHEEALTKAAGIKRLAIDKFSSLFKVEKFTRR